MNALLQKEWFIIQLSVKSLAFLTVVFFAVDYLANLSGSSSNTSFSQMIPVILGMQIHSSISYDEQSGFEHYALSLPLSKKTYIQSKYLTGLLLISTGFLATIAFGMFASLTQHRDLGQYLLVSAMASCMGLILIGISLPLIYKLGAEKARLWMMISMMVLISLLAASVGILNFEQPVFTLNQLVLISGGIGLAMLAFLFVSYRFSLKSFRLN